MSYIGSKINVTTITGFQYDGILTNINRHESTIEMQKVRHVATDGQPIKNGTVFDFIVLKSDDIKDLYVYEQKQAPEPAAPLYSDPAIVSAKPTANASTSAPSHHGQKPKETRDLQGIQFGSTATPHSSNNIAFGSVVEQSRPTRPQSIGRDYSDNQLVVNSESINLAPPSTFAAAVAAAPTFTPPSQRTQKVKSYSTVTKQTVEKEVPVESLGKQPSQRPHQRKPPTGPFVPNRDFDFEQSNQLFNKDQVAAEVAPVLTADGPYYNKGSSFFDNISSEISANSDNQDPKMKSEKSWNMETFGQPFVRGSSNSRRASRGGRGGGSHRGASGGRQRFIHHNATGSFP